jgi:GT2 family glycosyltransferase
MDPHDESVDLRRRIARLSADNAHLESRLERIEASVIFRFLRHIGNRYSFHRTRLRGVFGLPDESVAASQREYAAWIREKALVDTMEAAVAAPPPISVLLDARRGDYQKTLESIQAQPGQKSIYICTTGPLQAPGKLAQCPCTIEAVDPQDAMDRIRTDAVLLIRAGAILEPHAISAFAARLSNGAAAAYSDWDELDAAGVRHSPRFTPEISPELLLQDMYWGACFMARVTEVRETSWRADMSFHELALRLAERTVARIPRVLWHDAGPMEPAKQRASRPPVGDRASIVICSRSPRMLDECLEHVRRTIDSRHEIVVVAHRTSGADELPRISARHGAKSVDYDGAFHFGKMNELGVNASTGTVIVLMNDDVAPKSAGWLESMLAQAVRQEIGVVGALLYYPDQRIQHAGIVLGDSNVPAHAGRFGTSAAFWPWLKMTREVSAVTGACLAIRRSVWNEFGGFDARLPVNFNDVDLCLRAREKGYRNLIETSAVLVHKEAQTRIARVRAWEREHFWQRWDHLLDLPDPYFNPQLETADESIRLRDPWR